MMLTYMRRSLSVALAGVAALALQGCDRFVSVSNPNTLEADAIDPERDAKLLSQSAYQQFSSTLRDLPVYEAWFTNHARVGDTFPTRNDFGRRDIPFTNAHIRDYWNGIQESVQFSRTVIRATEVLGPTVDLARVYFVSATGIQKIAELYCEGTLAESTEVPRGPMSSNELLDSAIVDYQKVQEIAAQVSGTEAQQLSMAAQVGIARAHLQAGRPAEAAAAAALVTPDTFHYDFIRIDNSSQRALGNGVWSFSEARISLVVGPEFRAMADSGDPRIAYSDRGRLAQDGVLQFYRQGKFGGWGVNQRLASKLEARYIEVEANQNAAAMYAFINERRAVGSQPIFPATIDMDSLMTELMIQKARDFWLEGKDVADFRRNPDYAAYVLPTGDNSYYKPELGPVRDDTCWPVPRDEILSNPKWPQN
jgi:hypothetical protein